MKGLLTNLDVHQRFLREANEYVVELEEHKICDDAMLFV